MYVCVCVYVQKSYYVYISARDFNLLASQAEQMVHERASRFSVQILQ